MQQVREGSYDLDANMALLKLYQFYPSHLQNDVSLRHYLNEDLFSYLWVKIVLSVLLKGMMALPEPDFVMYKSLISSLTDEDMDKSVKRALGKKNECLKKKNIRYI